MSKPILFIDRDGTLIVEPETDKQVDAIDKMEFLPHVIPVLHNISTLDKYHWVMVTNQDGLGTQSFPEDSFWPAHQLMMRILESQGIHFDAVHIDRSFPEEGLPTRKPGTAMLKEYMGNPAYDMEHSFVIGDRHSDVELAQNLGCQSIRLADKEDATADHTCRDWNEIAPILLHGHERKARIKRRTKETDISVEVDLNGQGRVHISTGIGFFDHMLEQIAKHGSIDLNIQVKGDLHIDEHHTIEDTALALGEAFLHALGDKKGIHRYGFLLPMDESLAQVAIDFSGRPWLVWEAEFKREQVGKMPTEMFMHFFKSFSDTAKCTLNIKAEGENEHHKIEGIFKGFAKAIKGAIAFDKANLNSLPSTKGML